LPTTEEIQAHNTVCHNNWNEAEALHRKEHPEFYDAEGNPKDFCNYESREGDLV